MTGAEGQPEGAAGGAVEGGACKGGSWGRASTSTSGVVGRLLLSINWLAAA